MRLLDVTVTDTWPTRSRILVNSACWRANSAKTSPNDCSNDAMLATSNSEINEQVGGSAQRRRNKFDMTRGAARACLSLAPDPGPMGPVGPVGPVGPMGRDGRRNLGAGG